MRQLWKSPREPILILCLALAISWLALADWPVPFFWLAVAWATACIGGMWRLRKPRQQVVASGLFNVGVVVLACGIAELYVFTNDVPAPEYAHPYDHLDDALGTSPFPGVREHSSRGAKRQLIYNVSYGVDSTGLRVEPPTVAHPSACILFFGGSFTYGEGLQDNQALPYQVAVQSNGHYRTFNFGFHGYGPHQMLSGIEHGIVRRDVTCRPNYAIYSAIFEHIARVAGKVAFQRHAPKYTLDANGDPVFSGHFDDSVRVPKPMPWIVDEAYSQLSKSAIYQMIEAREPPTTDADMRLWLAVVRASRDSLVAEYPGLKFEVLLWTPAKPGPCPVCDAMQRGLRDNGMPVHRIDDMLPGWATDPTPYILSKNDAHPDALADFLIADDVVHRIVAPGVPDP